MFKGDSMIMIMQQKRVMTLLVVFLLMLAPQVVAAPGSWIGDVNIDGAPADAGALIFVQKDGNTLSDGSGSTGNTFGGNSSHYDIAVSAGLLEGDNLTFKVYDMVAGTVLFGFGPHYFDLNVSKLSNGASCTYAASCTGGSCCSGSCASSCSTSSGGGASGSSGGGGGGGSASAGIPEATTKAETTQSWPAVVAGSQALMNVQNADIAVESVVIDVKEAVTEASLTITGGLSVGEVSSKAGLLPGTVYQYLQFTPQNIGEDSIAKAVVSFKVPRTWLEKNELLPGDVALFRYVGVEWVPLATSVSARTVDYVHYQATTPGFSYFAVGSLKQPPIEEEPVLDTPTGGVVVDIPEEGDDIEEQEEPVVDDSRDDMSVVATVITVLVVLLVLVLLVMLFKRGKKKGNDFDAEMLGLNRHKK